MFTRCSYYASIATVKFIRKGKQAERKEGKGGNGEGGFISQKMVSLGRLGTPLCKSYSTCRSQEGPETYMYALPVLELQAYTKLFLRGFWGSDSGLLFAKLVLY